MDAVYEAIVDVRQHGEAAVLVTVVEAEGTTPARLGAKMLVRVNGDRVGTVAGGALERAAIARARELLASRRPQLQRYALTQDDRALEGEGAGIPCAAHASLFYDYIGHSHYAYIFGGGHVGRAIARELGPLPYYVTVIDRWPEYPDSVEGADRVVIAEYATALEDEAVPPGSYFLVATSTHEYDYVALRHIMASRWQPAYVGVIGSEHKARANLKRLQEDLGDPVPWNALYCPVGLDVGGPTPEEIAVAVAAEMQAVRYGRVGNRHMRLGSPLG